MRVLATSCKTCKMSIHVTTKHRTGQQSLKEGRTQRVLMFWFEMKPSAPREQHHGPHIPSPRFAHDCGHAAWWYEASFGLDVVVADWSSPRNICACLFHSHTFVSSMFLSHRKCKLVSRERRDPQVQGRKCLNLPLVTTWPNVTCSRPSGERATAPQPAGVFHHQWNESFHR